jgi:hypothetical protein
MDARDISATNIVFYLVIHEIEKHKKIKNIGAYTLIDRINGYIAPIVTTAAPTSTTSISTASLFISFTFS